MRLIDADKLLRDIEHYHLSDGKFQHWVEIQPTINPQPHWIPCSERLPEEDDEVLVTDDYDCIRHCVFCKRGETWRGFVTYEEGMTIDAIAWQPLPSPYWEEGEKE